MYKYHIWIDLLWMVSNCKSLVITTLVPGGESEANQTYEYTYIYTDIGLSNSPLGALSIRTEVGKFLQKEILPYNRKLSLQNFRYT